MKNSTFHLTKRILIYARPYWRHVIGLFLFGLLSTPIALMKPFIMKLLIDSGFGSERLPYFIRVFFPANFQFTFQSVIIITVSLAILIALVDNIYNYVSWIWSTYTGEKLVLNFRTLVFNHIQRLSLAYHDTKGASDSLYRIQYDTQSIRSLLLSQLSGLVTSSLHLVAMMVIMFIINWQFAIISLFVMPPLIYISRLSTKRLKKDWYNVKSAESNTVGVIHEVLGSLRVVKAFGQEEYENKRFSNQADKVVEWQLRMARIGASFSFIVNMLLAIASALFLYLGATFVHSGKMTLGELTLVLAYLGMMYAPLQGIIKILNDLQSSSTSIDRVFSVLNQEKEVTEKHDAVHLTRVKGHFQLKNVSFSYNKERPTLTDVSFSVRAGDRVGIMGSTGAGKSTLVSLLTRFYDPSSGKILIDGADVTDFKLVDFRKQFSLVLQEPVLFSTTIKENIKYARPDATEKEVIDAAIAANAHNFIMKTEHGYDTMVGERGTKLSGGERQRISLARAFIKDAPVLILDEPTSSLDIKTEALIMEAMERLMEGRTTFMITHRLDTLNSCNLILHLEHGKLVEVVRDHNTEFMAAKKLSFLNQPE
jgi:ATP-binding cassette, subfamily B, bacterial